MIFAPLEHAGRYLTIHPLFAEAFAWLEPLADEPWHAGRRPLRGDELWANLDEGLTKPEAECRFEAHRRYVDLQVSLAGGEYIDCAPVAALEVEHDFQPGGDVAFYRQPREPVTRLLLRPGFFAVFFPEDAHRPLVALESPASFRKCVVKVAMAARR